MNHAAHEAMDEMGDFAERPKPARYRTGDCRLLEDQSDSDDRDVVMFLLKLILALAAFNAVVYSLIKYFQS